MTLLSLDTMFACLGPVNFRNRRQVRLGARPAATRRRRFSRPRMSRKGKAQVRESALELHAYHDNPLHGQRSESLGASGRMDSAAVAAPDADADFGAAFSNFKTAPEPYF